MSRALAIIDGCATASNSCGNIDARPGYLSIANHEGLINRTQSHGDRRNEWSTSCACNLRPRFHALHAHISMCNCVATVKWQRRPNCNAELTEDDAVNRATASDRVSVLIYQFHFHFQFQFFDFSVFSLNYFLHTEK